MRCGVQEVQHGGQHADDAGEVREQHGGVGGAADGRADGGEAEDRPAALQHAAQVRRSTAAATHTTRKTQQLVRLDPCIIIGYAHRLRP